MIRGALGNRVVFWINHPGPYQGEFFRAVRESGVKLAVAYYERLPDERLRLGWAQPDLDPDFEVQITSRAEARRLLIRERAAVHILPGYGSPLILSLAIMASLRGIRWVHWSEPARPGWRWWLGYPRKFFYGNLVNFFALGALAIGENAAKDFRKWGIHAAKIRLLPYSRQRSEGPAGNARARIGPPLIFGFVGAICLRKGVDVAIRAFGQVARRFPETELWLVGSDETQGELHAWLAEAAAGKRIRVMPAVRPHEVFPLLDRVGVFLLLSRFDGWGVVLNEAALSGCALIATPACGATAHLITPGRNGVIVPAGAVAKVAEAMMAYAADPALAERHGSESLAPAREFTPEANTVRLRRALAEWVPSPVEEIS